MVPVLLPMPQYKAGSGLFKSPLMRRRILVLGFFLVIFSALLGTTGYVRAQSVDYSIHSNIIYRFTKYMNWPDSKEEGDFVIGVVGRTPVYNELKMTTAGKKAGTKKIVVKRMDCGQATYDCHILFIDDDESGCLKQIKTSTQNQPILLVTEREGLALRGAGINFVIIGGRITLEINKKEIENRDIKIASELLGLGKIIN